MFKKSALAAFVAAGMATSASAQLSPYPDTIVVLDVSNSMWGQIDGVSKMEIAREVIAELVADLETDSEFGLMAYGHRRTSDCGDIELILPVGPLDAAGFSAAVNGLTPRGRTPLTAAVRQAAEILNYEGRSGRIVLVSDGVESCDANPCALAEELGKNGLDFTTHVIGFDVGKIEDQSQLSCLADQTGGLYLTADSTQELKMALTTMMGDEDEIRAEANAPLINLVAVDSAGSLINDPNILWNITNVTQAEKWLTDEVSANISIEYQADEYLAEAVLGNLSGALDFTFDGEADATFEVVLNVAYSVNAPESVTASADFMTDWQGVDQDGDYIAVAKPDDELTNFSSYSRTSLSNPVTLTAPEEPGIYEVRYISAITGDLLATDRFSVEAFAITLTAPEEAETNSVFAVLWDATGREADSVAIFTDKGTADEAVFSISAAGASSTEVTAPSAAGIYHVQYLDGDGNVLASLPIAIFQQATLNAAPEAVAGSVIEVSWTGADLPDDYITIVETGADDGGYLTYAYTKAGNPASFRAPDEPGNYELRYGTDLSNNVMARLPITVTPAVATLNAPEQVNVSGVVEFNWTGEAFQGDFLTIVPVGAEGQAYGDFFYANANSTTQLNAPDTAGDYELRYVTGGSNLVLASAPITVIAVETSLTAPETAPAGAPLEITWQGPNGERDFITIVTTDAPEGAYESYAYTSAGNPATITGIDSAGTYEIRYVSGQSNATLARTPITLNAVEVSLETVTETVAGSTIEINWSGPGNDRDFLTVVATDADEGSYNGYTYTTNGSPLSLLTPDMSGKFELRYVSGQSNATLMRIPVTLLAPAISLSSEGMVFAGSKFQITWEGPDNQGDYLTISAIGVDDGQYETYEYTNNGSPLEITAPEATGSYEIRYTSGQSHRTLGMVLVSVVAE